MLAAQSFPLRAMFEGAFKEGSESVITLRDVEPSGFALLLDFLYDRDVEVTADNVEALLDLSARYGVSLLRRHCCAFLARSASPSNACSLLAVADRYDCHRLRRDLLAYTLEVCGVCSQGVSIFGGVTRWVCKGGGGGGVVGYLGGRLDDVLCMHVHMYLVLPIVAVRAIVGAVPCFFVCNFIVWCTHATFAVWSCELARRVEVELSILFPASRHRRFRTTSLRTSRGCRPHLTLSSPQISRPTRTAYDYV